MDYASISWLHSFTWINFDLCDSTSAIDVSKYTVHCSKAKNIDINHNFIRDHVENGNFVLKLKISCWYFYKTSFRVMILCSKKKARHYKFLGMFVLF